MKLENEINKFMEEDYIIILDSSVYLNIYEYSPEIGDFFINLLEKLKDKIMIPATVKREFSRNNQSALGRQKKKYKNIPKEFENKIKSSKEGINKQLLILERFKFPNINELKENIESKFNEIIFTLDEYVENHDIFQNISDDIFSEDKVKKFFVNMEDLNRYFPELSINELYKICEEGKTRYKKQVPPGFKDEKSKDGIDKYNDLIIWKECLKYAEKNNKNLIFVTDDVKEDWWENGKTFHKQLTKEFEDYTKRKIIGLNSEEFYINMSRILNLSIPDKVDVIFKFNLDDYINSLIESGDIQNIINEKLIYSGESYVNTSSLSNYDGSEFELSEEIDEINLLEYSFEGYEFGEANYKLKFQIKLDAFSRIYWGRDSDTKEVILSDNTITHHLKGYVDIEISREIELFSDDINENYEIRIDDIYIEMEEESFTDSADLCVECGKNEGIFFNSRGEPICNSCMNDDSNGFVCPACGLKKSREFDALNGFCTSCSEELDF
ncbi:PIN-like domain-containing protein [Haliovirga abyssi]|uniref:PIN like domain-containing protein n=1 Tax=Haliovirga abyssi TaxID=2996794 RepID=A0AAU9D4Q9_9FUSO|nr:PIN-like domain-containing protein [Haliovirga abyssi]BDU50944.1 hypothetical protein HLVA_15130 [Haliovirga abyssi]